MGREASISYDDVVTAAKAISNEGGKLSLRAIRERLGRGSLGTVQEHVRHWRESQTRTPQVSTLPPTLEQAILAFASEESAKTRAGLQVELGAAQQSAAELAHDNDRLTEALEQQGAHLEVAKAEAAKLTGQVEQMRTQQEASRRDAQVAVAAERERAEVARQAQSDAETRAAVATEKAAGLVTRLSDFEIRLREETQRHLDLTAKLEAELQEWRDGTRVPPVKLTKGRQ
jgi:hypothetical protein